MQCLVINSKCLCCGERTLDGGVLETESLHPHVGGIRLIRKESKGRGEIAEGNGRFRLIKHWSVIAKDRIDEIQMDRSQATYLKVSSD